MGNLFGGGGNAAQKAQEAYEQYAQQALDEMRRHETQGRGDISDYFQQGLGYEQPYMQAGQEGLQAYLNSLGITGFQKSVIDRFRELPGYKFALQQGQQSLQRQAAARGMSGSGAASKELARYGQGMADQEYGNYQNRLQGLATQGQQLGETAAQQAMGTGQSLANLGYGYAGDIGSIYQGMGQNAANAQMAQAQMDAQKRSNMWNMIGQIGGAAMGMSGLGSLFGGGGSSYGGYSPWLNPDTNRFYQSQGNIPMFDLNFLK